MINGLLECVNNSYYSLNILIKDGLCNKCFNTIVQKNRLFI